MAEESCVAAADRIIAGSLPPAIKTSGQRAAATLLRDRWGIPAVVAESDADALFGHGFAQGEDHLPELLFLVRQVRGDLAGALGVDCLESDRQLRTLGLHRDAQAGLERVNPEIRDTVLRPFAAGINAYAATVAGAMPAWAVTTLPVTEADVLALHGFYGFVLSMANDAWRYGHAVAAGPWGHPGGATPPPASNGIALSGRRTAGGHPILAANPHIALYPPFLMTEVRLKGARIDMRGWTFIGLPLPIFGHGADSAWAVTIGYPDVFDRAYLIAENGRYRFDGAWRAFKTRTESIAVRGAPPVPHTIREAAHGPVIADLSNGHRVALQWATRGATGMPEQLYRMATAAGRPAFEAALAMQQLPNYAVLRADSTGDLFYGYLGRVHRRDRRAVDSADLGCGPLAVDWWDDSARADTPCPALADWGGVLPGIPGWTSQTLPGPLHPFSAFPRISNPPSGWLQMANSPPWTAARLGDGDCAYPAEIVPCREHPVLRNNLRALRQAQRLEAMNVAQLADAASVYLDAYVTGARYPAPLGGCLDGADPVAGECGHLPQLLAAWERQAQELSAAQLAPAIDLLRRWDGRATPESRAPLLYLLYVHALGSDLRGQAAADAPAPLEALDRAAAYARQHFGRIDPPWGTVNRLTRRPSAVRAGRGASAAIPGAPQFAGALHASENARFRPFGPDDAWRPPDFGSVALLAVVLNPSSVGARAASVYGQSGDPASHHFADQLTGPMAKGQLREAPFRIEDLRAGARHVTVLRR